MTIPHQQPINIVFVCGPHAAGKTNLLLRLKQEGVIVKTGPEIGTELFHQKIVTPDHATWKDEKTITLREIQRDREIQTSGLIWGVESWHPGNLAYVKVRNRQYFDAMVKLAKQSPLLINAMGIWLDVDAKTIKKRTTLFTHQAHQMAMLYTRINQAIPECLSILNLDSKTLRIHADNDMTSILNQAIHWIKNRKI